MAEALSPADELRSQFQGLSDDLIKHIQLARDYANTPGNAWLSRNELNKASSALAELEGLLDKIKAEDAS